LKVTADCIPCLLKRSLFEVRLVGGDEARATRAALDVLHRDYSPDICSAVLATAMHRAVYDSLGDDDPYRELKKGANRVAKGLLPRAEAFVEGSEDRLRAAAICAVAGNVMDFGIEGSASGPEGLASLLDRLCEEGLGHDDLDGAGRLLGPGSRVVYFFDNCGEVILDALLVRELKGLGVHVTVVAKGEPILTDATLADAGEAGMEGLADVLLDTGTYAVGMDLDHLPPDLAGAMEGCDLIISKGMANYEAMSEGDLGPVLHLMRTKCRAVAGSLGLPQDISAAVLVGLG
jgi:uncharacterized protein with ATP-grasp and redox domains